MFCAKKEVNLTITSYDTLTGFQISYYFFEKTMVVTLPLSRVVTCHTIDNKNTTKINILYDDSQVKRKVVEN